MPEIIIPAVSKAAANLFACFSRFEFALKESGYVRGQEGEWVKPDWEKFTTEAKQAGFEALRQIEAVQPLFEEPPRKQLKS